MNEIIRKKFRRLRSPRATAAEFVMIAVCLLPASLLRAQSKPAPTIPRREFGSEAGTREKAVSTAHLDLKSFSTRDVVRPNLRFTLVAEIALKPKMHVYAPGVDGFIPVDFQVDSSPNFKPQPPIYPQSEKLYLAPIQRTVQVYQEAIYRRSQS